MPESVRKKLWHGNSNAEKQTKETPVIQKRRLLMSKARFIDSIKGKNQVINEPEKLKIVLKIEEKKRLSSEEFLKTYDSLWKDGPSISYNKPEVRLREFKTKSDA